MRSARKTILKIFLDTVILLLLAMMYQKRVICIRFHEIGGLILFGLFLLHNGLNWKWFKGVSSNIFQRGLPLRSRVNWLVNVLLFISMTATIGTGLLISKTLPTSIQQAYLVKPWHYFFAAAALILIGIHLGLHWKYLHHVLLSRLPLPQRAGKVFGCALLVLVLTFGAYSLTLSHFSAWLSGPFQISSALSERHQQFSAELPGDLEHIGDGKQGGISKGSGHGAGMGKGPQSETVQQPSIQNTFSAMATYVSIAVLFAWLEVMFEKMLFWIQGAKVLRRN